VIPTICFIVCHAGPAEHFAAFAQELKSDCQVRIWADDVAATKFDTGSFTQIKNLDKETAQQIALECQGSYAVMTDLGHPFDIIMQEALAQYAPQVRRFTYYDNPETHVPGEYNKIAEQVMLRADAVLIANAEIAVDESAGIGYYPIEKARRLARKREDHGEKLRAQLFQEKGLKDNGEKICVLIGGNNSEFYKEAFPAFCQMIPNDPKVLFFIQLHPSCKELEIPEALHLSEWSTEDMMSVAEVVLYHQSSMAPLLAFAGVPIIQVGKKRYDDLLTRSGVAFVSNEEELREAMESARKRILQPQIVGFRQDWPERLRKALQLADDTI